MSLRGHAAMLAWHGLAEDFIATHDEWHSREHMAERVSIEGFLRGRRYRSVDTTGGTFLMYEVSDFEVLTSPAYLERLNHPTPWTRQTVPGVQDLCRTLCRTKTSRGLGIGRLIWTLRLRTALESISRTQLISWLDEQVELLLEQQGLNAVHVLVGDADASALKNREKQLRSGDAVPADVVLLVEGYSAEVLMNLSDRLTNHTTIRDSSVDAPEHGLYHLEFTLDSNDLPANCRNQFDGTEGIGSNRAIQP